MSVYLSVAPPDGFGKWGDAEWERWLKDHPWEAAERICSRGDWAIFLYQLRLHAPKGKVGIEPLLEQLVNERPLTAQQTEDLRLVGHRALVPRHPLKDLGAHRVDADRGLGQIAGHRRVRDDHRDRAVAGRVAVVEPER